MYDTARYANSRLNGCYIWNPNNKRLFYVRDCETANNGDIHVYGNYTGEGNNISVPMKDFDLSYPRLGFVYDQGRCLYLMKLPMRRDWRQGLRSTNYIAYNFKLNGRQITTYGVDTRTLKQTSLQTCISGFKFDLDEAMEESFNNESCVPINRNFYIAPTGDVNYFHLGYGYTGLCGDIRNGQAHMLEGKEYLAEAFERSLEHAS